MNPYSECTPMKNTKKALYQRERGANPVVRSLEQSSENVRWRNACTNQAVRERESEQQAAAREEPGVLERESELWAAARQDPAVRARESRQRAVARGKKTYAMACTCKNGEYLFHQPCGLWNEPCIHGCGYIHLSNSTPGTRKKCCVNGLLSSDSDNILSTSCG